MELKPVLIETIGNIKDIQGTLIMRNELLFTSKELNNNLTHRKLRTDKVFEIILIDTEVEIVEGDCQYDFNKNEISSYVQGVSHSKVISSTNKSHTSGREHDDTVPLSRMKDKPLPQLSPQSIQLLINYYNEFGYMPESVEVKYEKDDYVIEWSSGFEGGRCQTCNKWFYGNAPKPCNCQHIKLNKQGEVDITIPEVEPKLYTEEEVKEFLWDMNTEAGSGVLMEGEFKDWFNKNKK